MKLFFIQALLVILSVQGFTQSHPATDDEFVGPFPSWVNVKTSYGATGNGIADETTFIQAAFDAISKDTSSKRVVYLPSGTYKITQTLRITGAFNIRIVGEDPTTTLIKWAGSSNDTMLILNGVAYSSFSRLTWDGNGSGIIVDQSWDGLYDNGKSYDGGNEYTDMIFQHANVGLQGGFRGNGFAEVTLDRDRFIACSVAGASFGNFNALDIWFRYCTFDSCYDAITNRYGAGNFKVYKSIFRNSSNSDIYVGNTGEFSFRNCYSSNSNAFLLSSFTGNPSLITIAQCTIVDPVQSTCISIRNQGPTLLYHDTIRSRVGAVAPVVYASSYPQNNILVYNNTFTVASAGSYEYNTDFGTRVVTRASLSGLAEPTLPGFRPNLSRTIFEVPAASSASVIQAAINSATASGSRSVVHLPYSTFTINSSLSIPANSDVQVIGDIDGDRFSTLLKAGVGLTGPVIQINGPSKATLAYLSVQANSTSSNIQVTGVNQSGARVYMNQHQARSSTNNLIVTGQSNMKVLSENGGYAGSQTAPGVTSSGSDVTLFSAATSDNLISFKAVAGGKLMVRDTWYESTTYNHYADITDSSVFYADGNHISSPLNVTVPQTTITNLTGKAQFSGSSITDRIVIKGNNAGGKLFMSNILSRYNVLNGFTTADQYHLIEDSSTTPLTLHGYIMRQIDINSGVSGSGSTYMIETPEGQYSDSAFFAVFFAPLLAVVPAPLVPTASGVTDLRFNRLWTSNGIDGMRISNGLDVIPDVFPGLIIKGRRVQTQ